MNSLKVQKTSVRDAKSLLMSQMHTDISKRIEKCIEYKNNNSYSYNVLIGLYYITFARFFDYHGYMLAKYILQKVSEAESVDV
jgi:hypothetical protein